MIYLANEVRGYAQISNQLNRETQSSPEKPNNKFEKPSNNLLIKLEVGPLAHSLTFSQPNKHIPGSRQNPLTPD